MRRTCWLERHLRDAWRREALLSWVFVGLLDRLSVAILRPRLADRTEAGLPNPVGLLRRSPRYRVLPLQSTGMCFDLSLRPWRSVNGWTRLTMPSLPVSDDTAKVPSAGQSFGIWISIPPPPPVTPPTCHLRTNTNNISMIR